MRKTLAVVSATGALLFGGVGVAHATVEAPGLTTGTTTVLAEDSTADDSDNTGLWGLAGLLGLLGLAGLKRRNDTARPVTTTNTAPRGGV
jgi:MYXO-CTERM domain-containing protein